jgi:hypothetical protein
MKTLLIGLGLLVAAGSAWACDQTTYAGCSATELRAIQQQQFKARKSQSSAASQYWRDRQYVDRLRSEDRAHEVEIERIRAQAEIEVARNEQRSWRRGGYYFYRPPLVVAPLPIPPPVVQPKPELRGAIYSNSQLKRVPNAVQ